MAFLLSLILLISGLFRLPFLHVSPPELFGDELDVGYQAYSLLKTGRDVYNQPLPTLIHSFSEWRAPFIVYQTIPGIALFGLNNFGVRLPEAFMGVISPVILFILVYELSRSKSLATIPAVVLSLMPWHIIYSRMGGFGSITLINLIMLSVLLFHKRRFILSIVFVTLSLYTYNTALIFLPLLYLPLLLVDKYRPKVGHMAVLLVLLIPLGFHLLKGTAGNRFSQISLTSGTETLDIITNGRNAHPGLIGKLLYNRPGQYLSIFTRNYFQSFSTEFLFLRGDPIYRHSVQIVGGLLPVTAVFLLLGLALAFKRKEWLWLMWLFLAPIPSALTADGGYHATRLFLMVPALAVLIAQGVVWFKDKKILLLLCLSVFVLQLANFSYYYLTDYPKKSWRWWAVGYQDAITNLNKLSPDYSRVFVNNTYEPSLVRYLFWTAYDPAKFHKDFTLDQEIKGIVPNYDGFVLGSKVFFGQFSNGTRRLMPGAVYLISQRDDVGGDWDWRVSPPDDVLVLHTSTSLDNQPVFYLITKK